MKLLGIIFLTYMVSSSEISSPFIDALAQISESASKFDWGRTFQALLELNLSQPQKKTDELVIKLGELRDKIAHDIFLSDSSHAIRQVSFQQDIFTLQQNLNSQQNEQRVTNSYVADLQTEIASILDTMSSQARQLQILNGREEDLRNTHSNDQIFQQMNTLATDKRIMALNQIVQKLTDAIFSSGQSSFTEVDQAEVVNTLKQELGESNPLVMLISITSKFNVPTVTSIIKRLEVLRDSMMANQVRDEETFNQSNQRFNTIINEINNVRNNLKVDQGVNKTEFLRKKNELFKVISLTNYQLIECTDSSNLNGSQQYPAIIWYSQYIQFYHESLEVLILLIIIKRKKELQLIEQAYKLIYQAQSEIKTAETHQ